jgi:hypothetical protein
VSIVTYDDYDKISEQIRQYCAQKLMELEQSLADYVNGNMGEISPAHATAYITVLKELGRLYGAQKPPRDPEAMIPASKVQILLQAAETRAEIMVREAIAETEQRIRAELEGTTAGSVAQARATVLARLQAVHSSR